MLGGRIEPDLLEVVLARTLVAHDVEVDAVVELQRPFPAHVQRVERLARQIDDDRRTRAADVGALDHHIRGITLVLPRERAH